MAAADPLFQELLRQTNDQTSGWREVKCFSCKKVTARVVTLCQWDNHIPSFSIYSQDAIINEAVRRLRAWDEICRNPARVVVTLHGSNCPNCGITDFWESVS